MLKDVLCILNYKRNIHVFPKNEAPSIEVNQSKLQNDSNKSNFCLQRYLLSNICLQIHLMSFEVNINIL